MFFPSVIWSSLHLEVNIFIQDRIITAIAIPTSPIFRNLINVLLIVATNTSVFMNKF
ncbi:MAG: hypothetical protein LBQ59_05270 [Candidatus Peribacteria bacterium]|nr:hypothetical protein [Candidatus Peribacteria bacterium]